LKAGRGQLGKERGQRGNYSLANKVSVEVKKHFSIAEEKIWSKI